MENTVKERIVAFVKAEQITAREFERRCGLSNGYVNNLKASPSSAVLQKILYAFPDLSQSWLLTGEGPMLAPASESDQPPSSSIVNGPHGTQAVGDGARAVNGEGVKECLEIMKRQQESISKLAETVDRLTRIISERQVAL